MGEFERAGGQGVSADGQDPRLILAHRYENGDEIDGQDFRGMSLSGVSLVGVKNGRLAAHAIRALDPYAFLRKQVFSTSPLTLSALHSISPSSPVRRIFLINVPRFKVTEVPLTFKSLMTWTLSPSFRGVPLLSFTMSSVMSGLPACGVQ
jgi:hypothetical protein